MKRLITSSTLVVGLVALLAACGGGGPPQPPYTPGKISGQLVYPDGTGASQSLQHNGEMMASNVLEFEVRHAWTTGNGQEGGRTAEVVPGDVIVFYEDGLRSQGLATESLANLGISVAAVRTVAAGRLSAQLYHAEGLDEAETVALAARIASLPGVASALPNRMNHAFKTPNDPYYPIQWHYGSMNLPAAWDIEDGASATSSPVTVAVLDSGKVNNPDLEANLLPGYDFVSDLENSGDGDGRDPDPTDLGGSTLYHGTHVSGTIAAVTNNVGAVAGVSWGAKVVPVRVLGLMGGTTLDIMEGLLWAAGYRIEGIPDNPNPASIINMSLGGNHGAPCDSQSNDIFGQLAADGVIVVVAAGNDNIDTEHIWPASCSNVITVGATGPTNDRAPYSNFGAAIDVMAAGGDTTMSFTVDGSTFPAGVLSTSFNDATGDFALSFMDGTSMASPHIAGIVALMRAQDPGLTFQDVKDRLQMAATPLDAAKCLRPSGLDCGAGLVDAAKALVAGGGTGPGPGPGTTPPPPPPPPTNSPITYVAALYCGADCNNFQNFDYSRSRETAVETGSRVAPFELGDLEPGPYVVAAWQDLNDDGEVDDNEPFGVFGDISDPQTWLFEIRAGQHRQGVLIVMQPLSLYSASQLSTSSAEQANVAAAMMRQLRSQ